VDPQSTLEFRPSHCTLRLEGGYAILYAMPEARKHAGFFLYCREDGGGEESLSITYRGPALGDAPFTDLADPYHTGGRENVSTVNYAFGGPHAHARYRFERGELRFHRPPRALLDIGSDDTPDSAHVELGVDLHFEGDRRFRAALRICPDYPRYGPVSDPVE
jgi:hypothetical protein